MVDFDIVWHRLLEAAKAENNAQLAAFLGLRPQTVSKAKCARSIPKTWWVIFREKTGVTWEELNRAASPVPAQIAVANGDGNQVANSVHAAPVVSSPGPVGDIARELCGLIAERLEGKKMDEQIAFYNRVKAAVEGE